MAPEEGDGVLAALDHEGRASDPGPMQAFDKEAGVESVVLDDQDKQPPAITSSRHAVPSIIAVQWTADGADGASACMTVR